MKKSAVYLALCAVSVCVFLFSAGMTYASWKTQGDTVNKINMASVRGQIVEEYEQNQVVYPNSTVDKIVQVKNTGTADALPRVKIEKVWGDSRDENGKLIINPDLSTDNIEITYNTEQWIYNSKDGYYYYKEVLKPGDITVSLFDSFKINGEKTGGEYKNKLADIVVNMEMVQAAGNGLSYWNTSFEELGIVYKQTNQVEIVTKVDFNSPNNGFSFDVNEGDLFADFKNLVPGESRSQVVEIKNKWNQQTEIFLWADFIDQTQATDETRELIDKLLHEYAEIVITDDDGNVIYDGAVWGSPNVDSKGTDSMKYPYNLGIFKSNQTKKLNVSLSLDPKMDNEYKDLLGLIKWVFSAQGDEPPAPTQTSTSSSSEAEPITKPIDNSSTVTDDNSKPDDDSSSVPDDDPSAVLNENDSSTTDDNNQPNPSTGGFGKVGMYGVLTLVSFLLIPITYRKAKYESK